MLRACAVTRRHPHRRARAFPQAGLSALKTPLSLADGCCREDPLHLPAFRQLAEGLPYARHVHSKLICAITHELMDEHNPPAALPNGCDGSGGTLTRGASGLCCRQMPLAGSVLPHSRPPCPAVRNTAPAADAPCCRPAANLPPRLRLPRRRHVYSQKALLELAAVNGGRVTCPRTGFACDVSELRRVYIS